MSPERGKCLSWITITALMIVLQVSQANGHHRPFNRIIGTLEHFWKLGWKGFRSFPLNFPHLTGVHMNHHRWQEFGPPALGMPIEGILERKDHPLHEWAKRMQRNGVVATHLNDYTRGKVIPYANVHANIQERGQHIYKSMAGLSPPNSMMLGASQSAHQFLAPPPPADPLLNPPFLVNPFATPDAPQADIDRMSEFINTPSINDANLQASSSVISSSPWNRHFNDHLLPSPSQYSPALPIFSPNEMTEKEFESFESMVKKWNDSQDDANAMVEEGDSSNGQDQMMPVDIHKNKNNDSSTFEPLQQMKQEESIAGEIEKQGFNSQGKVGNPDETVPQ